MKSETEIKKEQQPEQQVEQPKIAEYRIRANEVDAIFNYLGTKPYQEVVNFMAILQDVAKNRMINGDPV